MTSSLRNSRLLKSNVEGYREYRHKIQNECLFENDRAYNSRGAWQTSLVDKKTGTAYGNPWDIYEENGCYMDYISAMRIIREMQEDSVAFYSSDFTQSFDDDDEEVPF